MFGKIYICHFPFSSGGFSKPRPALALFDAGGDVVICRVTSVARNEPHDVVLADWATVGLLKPSVARINRLITVEKNILVRQIGMLSVADQQAVRHAWNLHMKL